MIAWLLACGGGEAEAPPRSAVPPLEADGPVFTAPVVEVPAELPARFDAMLATPPSLASGGPDRYPPVGLAQDGLCAGEGPWREQLSAATRALAPAERWRFWELTMLPWCRSPGWCEWLGAEARALGPEGTPFWIGLTTCGDEATAALVEEAAPDELFLQWVLAHPGPFRPRLSLLAARDGADPERRAPVLAALQQTDGPDAERALLALYAVAPPSARDEIAMHMGGREDPRAQRLHRAACAGSTNVACRWERPEPLRDVAGAVRLGADADGLLARYPNHGTALRAGLAQCVADEAATWPSVAESCARALAAADRDAARDALGRVAGAAPELDALLRALAVPDLPERLRELGFAVPPEAEGATALDVLAAAGVVVPLDEGEGWPPRHERLLYGLARAAGLADVDFDELVPSDAAPAVPGRVPRIALFAWLDGARLRTLVADEAEGWDAVRAVGLVNAVLRRRGAAARIAIEDGATRAVAGPPAALEALAADGLVTWATLEHQ